MKNRAILALLLLSTCMLWSCDDFFELDRPETEPWQLVSDLAPAVSTSYKTLFNRKGLGNPYSKLTNYIEVLHDVSSANPWGMWTEAEAVYSRNLKGMISSGYQYTAAFEGMYTSLANTNNVLAFINRESLDGGCFERLTADERTLLNTYKGEMYFMRGYAYYMLSQMFMPPYNEDNLNGRYIPFVTAPRYNFEELRNPYIGTIEEIYNQMVSDFAEAKDLLPEDHTRGHANKYAASGMLMRLYFLMGDKASTKDECDYIINSGAYNLNEQPIRAFNRNAEPQYTKNPVASEVIFEAVQTVENNKNGNIMAAVMRITKAGQWNFSSKADPSMYEDENWTGGARNYISPTTGNLIKNYVHGSTGCLYWNPYMVEYIGWSDTHDPMADNFGPNAEALSDLRYVQLHHFLLGNNGDPKADPSVYEMGGNRSKTKYKSFWNDKFFRAPVGKAAQMPLLRLPEVYLTRASVDPASALGDVNIVRARAGLAPLSAVTEVEVEKERIKELAFETGDRILYLAAMKRPIPAFGKRYLDQADNDAVYNPVTSSTPLPDIAPPYADMYVKVPDSEYLFSDSYK